jgi:glycosidase
MRKTLLLLLILASLLTSCGPTASTEVPTAPWWGDAVFYEIFVRSFYDSNGDGIGDFNGITEKLDYLNDGDPNTTTDLGVTGIWLMPIFPSPSYHGYDVTDYYGVNSQYGTMEDFKKLLEEAHKRGIRIVIDLVINHTSDQHPWFKEAKRDKNSKYRDWYIWSETNPGYKGPWNESVWHSSTTGFYYGIFTANMPDLNFNNRQVTKEIEKVMDYWLTDVGVDGFRMDAIKHLIEEGTRQENTTATHEWLQKNFYPTYKSANPEAVVVGELSGNDANSIGTYVKNKQFDMAFNFQLASAFISSANSRSASYASRALELSTKILDDSQFAPFLTNHDQDRIMSDLRGDVEKAKVAASLLLTSPGTPFIYYGEEIGMQGRKPDENIRLPMQWSEGKNSGFTTGKPWRTPNSDYTTVNVALQNEDPNSLLSHYRALIQLRNANSALRTGSYATVQTDNDRLFASLRISKDEAVLVLINTGEEPISTLSLKLNETSLSAGDYLLTTLLGAPLNLSLSVNGQGGFSLQTNATIPAYTTVVLEFKLK